MELRVRVGGISERRVSERRMPDTGTQPFANRALMARLNEVVIEVAGRLEASASGPVLHSMPLWREYALRPGKRVRPYLTVLGFDAGRAASPSQPHPEGLFQFAAALELLHSFLLIHDDVADRADTRRGEPALHVMLRPPASPSIGEADRQRIGNDLAVVAGDFIYTAAMEAMLSAPGLAPSRLMPALAEVLAVCRSTAEGQFNDIAFGAKALSEVSPDDVLEVYRLKTARYTFEGPLVAGAKLAGASSDTIAALRDAGTGMGIAFQLEDDLLSLFAKDEEIGKPALADLKEGKKTWPVLTAYARSNAEERAWLDELFARGDATLRDLVSVRMLVRRTGALNDALAMLERYCDEAERALYPLADVPAVEELLALVSWLRVRGERWR